MNLKPLLSALSATYAIEPTYGLHMAAIAHMVYEGKLKPSADAFEVKANANYTEEYTGTGENGVEVSGNLSIIEMKGPMFREDQFCGPMGMVSMAEKMKAMDADASIDAHVIDMHTPGGELSGLETLANVVANLEKPVVLFGEDILSAGFYTAAGADSIVLSGKNARVGSIGVQLTYASYQKMFEKMGIEEVSIKATTSPDKNAFDFDNMSEEDKERYAIESLDPLDANFMDHVKAHRADVPDSALTGKVYFAEQALELGLADHIGTIEDAKQLALDMAGKPIKITGMKKENKGQASTEAPDLQAQLNASQDRIVALEDIVSAKEATISEQLKAIGALEAKVEDLKKENDRLAALPATDTEASTSAPAEDAANKNEEEKVKGLPVPTAIQEALDRGKARKARQLAKQKSQKTE